MSVLNRIDMQCHFVCKWEMWRFNNHDFRSSLFWDQKTAITQTILFAIQVQMSLLLLPLPPKNLMTAKLWALASIFLPTPNLPSLRSPVLCCVIPGDGFLSTCPNVSILVNYYVLFSSQTPLDTRKGAVTNECPMFKVTMGMTTGPLATAWAQTCWYGWALGLRSTLHSITCGRRLATNWTTVPMGRQGKNRQRVTSEHQ